MWKKVFFVIVLAVFLTMVYASGNARDVSIDKIDKDLHAQTDIAEMHRCTDRDLLHFIKLNYRDYDSYIYYRNTEALNVSELLIIKAYHKEDIPAIQDSIEDRIAAQIKTYESYGPEQVAMLKNAIIRTKGNYLFYCVSKTPEKYKEVFDNAV